MLFSLKSVFIFLILLISAVHVNASRCQVKAAQAYIKALASHSQVDADAVPLEKDVVRYETSNGATFETAHDAKSLRKSLVSGVSAHTIYNARDEHFKTLNSTAIEAIYVVDVGFVDGKVPITTTKVYEYYTFKSAGACKIHRMDITIYIGKG